MTQPDSPTTAAPHDDRQRLATLLSRIEEGGPGVVAHLRRANPDDPPPAFFRVVFDFFDDDLGGVLLTDLEKRWCVLAAAIAKTVDLPRRQSLGVALAEADVAEMRVLRLLQTEPGRLADTVRTIVQQLVSKGEGFELSQLRELVLARTPERLEDARRRIARDYYRHAST